MADPKTEPESTPHPRLDMSNIHWNLGVSSTIADWCLWDCFVLVRVLLELLCRLAGQFLSFFPPVPAFQGYENDPRTVAQLSVSVDGVSQMLAPQRTRTISEPVNAISLVLQDSHEGNPRAARWRLWEEAGGSVSLPSMGSRAEGLFSAHDSESKKRLPSFPPKSHKGWGN